MVRRHPPLVRRGYWARTAATRAIALEFGSRCEKVSDGRFNVVNVGCGYDTFGLWTLDRFERARVVELDFADVIRARSERLREAGVERSEVSYESRACDVRDVSAIDAAIGGLKEPFDWSLPTLVIAECVLAYLPPGASDAVTKFFGERLNTAVFASYDPIEPDDAFGRQMIRNVRARGCAFAGIGDAPSVEGARARFERSGWQRAFAYDMNAVYARLSANERERIEKIDFLDEYEEWRLILAHYCISVGVNDAVGALGNFDLISD